MAANITLIKKLQKAINSRGERLLYNTSQWYSDKQQRPITVYHIKKAMYGKCLDELRALSFEL